MSILPDSLTFMQRVQDAARLGYPWYVTGELSFEKWPSLEIKLSELYDCNLPKSTRSKRRSSAGRSGGTIGASSTPRSRP